MKLKSLSGTVANLQLEVKFNSFLVEQRKILFEGNEIGNERSVPQWKQKPTVEWKPCKSVSHLNARVKKYREISS